LVIVFQLCPICSVRADEQVRQLQQELRKRHLFFANPDGEFSPALGAALARYQNKKGLPVTGLLDAETCASLGIPFLAPEVAPTPFVVKRGDVRGMNGELLPDSTPLFATGSGSNPPDDTQPTDYRTIAFAAVPNQTGVEIRLAGKGARQRARTPIHRATVRRESNPFVLAFQSVDRALKVVFRDTQPRKRRDPKKRG
jgi:peptidoglycan hydrolase-like protein with peptidoglycan-binding domain